MHDRDLEELESGTLLRSENKGIVIKRIADDDWYLRRRKREVQEKTMLA